ncbi:MAG TPA: TIGR03557 family F420-dependent LLM class oxidoreductase [Candidatus Limnocylindrales bacterium]|nr:TIGR03557 family F420-dependent LLM class oxidoreductase [Candidatus Limnocylindrales bacterium]
MKFGWLSSHESNQPEDLVTQAIEAERAGFDAVFASDHFHPWVDDAGSAAGFVWAWLGAVAERTERVELATLVTAPLFHYHPALVAQAAATLDRLSGGRFRLGVGTGEAINERPMGFPFPGYRERADRLAEAIEIMRRLLAGEKVTYEGRYYHVDRAKLYSPPLHGVPIWMAAGGPQSATMAGKLADGLIVSVKDPAEAIEKSIDPFKAAGGEGKTIVATRWCVYAHDREEGWQALRPMRGLRAPGRLEAVDPKDLREAADEMPREEIFSKYAYAADADELFEVYRPLVESVGADYVSVQVACVDPLETIRLMGREVLPRLRELAADRVQASRA